MKHIHKNISIVLVILVSVLFVLVGCSDMMVKMGEIVLQVMPEDTIRTTVASYSITGNLESSRSSINLPNLLPSEEVVIPNIAPGKWTFTVTAHDANNNDIGSGTKEIVLIEGQKVNLKVPVVFVPLPLTISDPIIPNLSKIYDGTNTLDVTVGSLNGVVAGDTVSVTATATYADKSVGSGKAITVTYALNYPEDTDILDKYAPPADYTVNTGVITEKQLTISAPTFPDSKNKIYDGTNTLAVTAGDLNEVVEGDDVTVVATATYADEKAQDTKALTVTYTLSGADAGSYFKPVDNTANTGDITKKPLTFTVVSDDKTYDGDATAIGTVTLTGVLEEDANEVGATGTFSFSDKNVGPGKSVSVNGIALSGTRAGNYSLVETTASTTATISKKTFNMDGISFGGASLTYDGNAHPLAIVGTLPDGVTVSYSTNNNIKQAGTYEVIASFAVDADNHETIPEKKATLEIEKRALTSGGTYLTLSKAYDKNASVYSTLDQDASGKVTGDDMLLTVSASYDDKSGSIGKNKFITVSYALSGSDAGNYSKPADYSVNSGAIKPIQLHVSNPSFSTTSKIYDGDTNLGVTAGNLSGILANDVVTIKTATASYGNKNVGSNKAITVAYELEGAHAANYLAPADYTVYTGVITPIQLSISEPTFPDSKNKEYDGSTTLNAKAGSLSGVLTSDTVSVTATARFASKNAGSNAITVSYALTGDDAANYLVPASNTANTGTITARQLGITAPSFPGSTDKAYDGNSTLAVNEGTLSGFVAGDWITYDAVARYETKDVGDSKTITVTYSIDGPNAGNYLAPIADVSHTGKITGPKLTISDPILEKTKEYDSSNVCQVTPGNIVTGIVGTEDVRVLATATYNDKKSGSNKTITVRYSLTGDDSGKYIAPDDYIVQTGMIEKKQLKMGTLPIPTMSKEYDGTGSVAFTAGTVTGMYGPDDIQVNERGSYQEKGVGNDKSITFTYTLVGDDAANYAAPANYTVNTGVITRKVLTVVSDSTLVETSKTYDGTASVGVTNPGTLQGVALGEDVTLVSSATYASKNAGSNAITVTYSLSGYDAANYIVPSNTALTGTITKKVLTVQSGTTQINAEKLYDGTATVQVTNHGTLQGVPIGDDVDLVATATYATKDVGINKALTVIYSLSGSDAENYTAPANNTSFTGTITNGQLFISDPVLAKTKIYNSSNDSIVTPGNAVQGVIGNDSVQVQATATYEDKNVGTGKEIRVVYTLTGRDAGKYQAPVPFVTNDGEILHKQLSITAPTIPSTSKPYDGSTSVLFTRGTLTGVHSGDTVSVVAHGFYLSSSVENDKRIFFNYTLGGSDAANYIRPGYDVVYGAEITRKALAVASGTTGISTEKLYDRSTTATVNTVGTLVGVVGTEEVTLEATAVYEDANAGENKDIIVTYALGGRDAVKYSVPASYTVGTGNITKRPLTIVDPTFPDGKDRAYDGTTTLSVSAGALDSISGDDVIANATATYADKNASETAKTITIAYELSGSNMGNYSKPADNTSYTGTINPKPLTIISENTLFTKTYNGNPGFYTGVPTVGILESDRQLVYVSGVYTLEDANVGVDKPVRVTGIAVKDSSSSTTNTASNYSVVSEIDGTVTVTPKLLTISQVTVSPKTYDGTTNATGSLSLDGVIAADSENVSATGTFAFTDADAGNDKTVNVTGITLGGAKASNYVLASTGATGSAIISQKQLTVSALANHKNYDGNTNATGVISLGGVLAADSANVYATGTFAFANPNAGNDKTVNVTEIALGGAKKDNYSLAVTSTTAQASINMATYDMSKIFFIGATFTYDGNTHPLAISGTLPSDVTVSYSINNGSINAGTYQVTASFIGDATNYHTIPSKTVTLTINQATMTGGLSITGTAKEGQTLTCNASLSVGSNPSYQWKRNGTSIAGAIGTSYTLVAADVGNAISVTATATGNYTGSITSSSTASVESNAPPAPDGTIAGYSLTSVSDQNIINLTGFVANTSGLEAAVDLGGTSYGAYESLLVDARGRARIYMSGNAIANTTKVKVRVAAAGTVSAGSDKEITLGASRPLSVGDFYQGGVVAYLGSFTVSSVVKKGLIAAETDQTALGTGIDWCDKPFVLVGVDDVTNSYVGAGLANTNKIIEKITEARGASYTNYAAFLARSYAGGGKTDWFLPSQEEVRKLYENQTLIGNFTQNQVYWSSTESLQGGYGPLSYAQVKPFNSIGEWVEYKDRMHDQVQYDIQVRAVRYF